MAEPGADGGFFITFEGGEGAGKSTQTRLLAENLRAAGREVVLTREPGGTGGGELIRELLVKGEAERWSSDAEALLNYAARDAHLRELIRPALARGALVVCDRFMDSSRVYQGYAGGSDLAFLDALDKAIVARTLPDLTFVLDISAEKGLQRAGARGDAEDRFERKAAGYHAALRDGFRKIAADNPERCVLLDATRPEAALAEEIQQTVAQRLAG